MVCQDFPVVIDYGFWTEGRLMTLPNERTSAVKRAEELLIDLLDPKEDAKSS